MTMYYLLRQDGTISDIADYPNEPTLRADGTWVEGAPDPTLVVYTAP
jgi:hypothetical protein